MSPIGFTFAIWMLWVALAPSLIAREWWMTAINVGVCMSYGYLIGFVIERVAKVVSLKEQVAAGNGNQGVWLGLRGEQQAQVWTNAGRLAGCHCETLGFHWVAWSVPVCSAPGSLFST